MQDLLVAIIVSWILFRLFRPVVFVQWGGKRHSHQYGNVNTHHGEGELKVNRTQSRKTSEEIPGDYIDFEELPADKKN